jgi:hypothetical protein
MALITKL